MGKRLELHLARLPLGNDTELFEFDSIYDLTHKINSLSLGYSVFLCCIDMDNDNPMGTEIYVSEHLMNIEDFIELIYCGCEDLTTQFKVFLQEYQTYKDAYAVCLDMREENEKCYN